ncbi:zincin [Anaeromyces robustus]|uniref:Zincin n=1 Tax=Anaeromyces robustus TaxID=1754192 RepID=A0A1Y1XKD9_9FUNG|nr:zincin [Anaeromyces robustus]|eukprot:ORX86182.1 zincin [Anaeromyces robustus]
MLDNYEKTTKDGKEAYIIKANDSNSGNIMYYAKNENTRRTLKNIQDKICESNAERMKEIINIRTEIAKASGYETFSDYQLKDYMAKDLKTVLNFLEDLKQRLKLIFKNHINKLLELKNDEKIKLNETTSDLGMWDYYYYNRIYMEKEYNIDYEEVKEYFPIDSSVSEIIKIFEELYSIKCIKNENPSVWDDDVQQYEVYDSKTNNFMGTFYLDLYKRESKYNAGMTIPLRAYTKKEDGSEEYPVSALLLNFSKSTTSVPTLLSLDDLKTLIHEFGHLLHIINIKSKWMTNLESIQQYDYSEVPSQMQENFLWEPLILERISHHYQDYNKKLPKKLIDSLIEAKNVDNYIFYIKNVGISLGDIKLYSKGEMSKDFDITKYWSDIQSDVVMLDSDIYSEFAQLEHMVDFMPSTYYTYLWSLVLAHDVYSKISENGIINPEIGMEYRETILKSAGNVEPMEHIKQFLGREPNNDAFIETLGA